MGLKDIILPVHRSPGAARPDWSYVFGSATLVAFIVQVVTGVALARLCASPEQRLREPPVHHQ